MNLATLAIAEAAALDGMIETPVTADPRTASSKRCVLVAPPEHDFREKLTRWTLVVLAGTDSSDLGTLEILAGIVEELSDAGVWLEEATPGVYALVRTEPPVPAYLLTYTTSN